jgi:hypothetical protein
MIVLQATFAVVVAVLALLGVYALGVAHGRAMQRNLVPPGFIASAIKRAVLYLRSLSKDTQSPPHYEAYLLNQILVMLGVDMDARPKAVAVCESCQQPFGSNKDICLTCRECA